MPKVAKTAEKAPKTVKATKSTAVKKAVAEEVVKEAVVTESVKPMKEKKTITLNKGLKAPVFDIKGSEVETTELPKELFAGKENPTLVAQAVRVYLANQRQGNASTKTRGEVTGSTKKIYQQKHTGRARHGGKRAPIFVHGGIAHGPKPRDYSLKLPEKMKKAALVAALTGRVADGSYALVKDLFSMETKTKVADAFLTKLGMTEKRSLLVVTGSDNKDVVRSLRNLTGVQVTSASRLTTYEVLAKKYVLFMSEALPVLQERVKAK